ncbi:uncharacterized protein ARMOST_18803 [Armillaria ostoyae]|uniref:Uncharacterized protein n=1 Tax=Armillaria ostoyae TaxID=47428 RepID=A0A284S2R9_ARMOS|nr:uncharacterized protein ARMOST_18803 [Armillaria ostoyae]
MIHGKTSLSKPSVSSAALLYYVVFGDESWINAGKRSFRIRSSSVWQCVIPALDLLRWSVSRWRDDSFTNSNGAGQVLGTITCIQWLINLPGRLEL